MKEYQIVEGGVVVGCWSFQGPDETTTPEERRDRAFQKHFIGAERYGVKQEVDVR